MGLEVNTQGCPKTWFAVVVDNSPNRSVTLPILELLMPNLTEVVWIQWRINVHITLRLWVKTNKHTTRFEEMKETLIGRHEVVVAIVANYQVCSLMHDVSPC